MIIAIAHFVNHLVAHKMFPIHHSVICTQKSTNPMAGRPWHPNERVRAAAAAAFISQCPPAAPLVHHIRFFSLPE